MQKQKNTNWINYANETGEKKRFFVLKFNQDLKV